MPAALSTQPRSPGLGSPSPGKWVTKMPGKERVAASRLSSKKAGSHTKAIEGKPCLHMASIVLTLKGATATAVPKRRKARSSPM